jgi:hypothetical protein
MKREIENKVAEAVTEKGLVLGAQYGAWWDGEAAACLNA